MDKNDLEEFVGKKEGYVCFAFDLGSDLSIASLCFCQAQRITPCHLYSVVWALALARILQVEKISVNYVLKNSEKDTESLLEVLLDSLPKAYVFDCENMALAELLEDVIGGDGYNLNLKKNPLGVDDANCMFEIHAYADSFSTKDFVLSIENGETFHCNVSLCLDYSESFAQILLEVFQEILLQAITYPMEKLNRFRLISVMKQEKILDSENRSVSQAQDPQTFLSLFSQNALSAPSAIAVEFCGKTITYKELDILSDKVAFALHKKCLRSQCIGLSTPKNIEMIVGLLGILKSGNIYVPIDYEYPQNRVRFIVDDCSIAAMMMTKDTPVDFPYLSSFRVEDLIAESAFSASLPLVTPLDVAYVIYTSGTTGQPKGIPIKHSMLYQTIITNIKIQGLHALSRMMQFASISFDASIVEIFPALAVGATLVLPQGMERKDPVLLISFLKSHGITSANIPPALLAVLPHSELPRLSTIVMGGDSASLDVIRYWSRNRLLINAYGPTENCVDATYAVMSPDSQMNDIGCSMPGVCCYVLDRFQHLMPDYAVGELYIGGVKLTEGYINRSTLNAEKFVTNPFATEADKKKGVNLRLYKTGDLVMRRADGHLIFIGRSDFQVKLNGYRIELGDIEAKILEFGDVEIKNAVVVMDEYENRKRLVAYVQTPSVSRFPMIALKDFLHKRLPEYMVPAVFVPLEQFPYNVNGKVDRKLLPPAEFNQEKRNVDLPVTETELQLATVWTDILGCQDIGRNDSFIDLGGDSIAVIQLAFRIQEVFGCEMKASDVYRCMTLKDLAGFIDEVASEGMRSDEVSDGIFVEPFSLPPALFSLWKECMKSDDVKDAYNLLCVMELPSAMNLSDFETAFNRLVEVQDAFRISFPMNPDGMPFMQVAPYVFFNIDVFEITEEQLGECLNDDVKYSFDLAHAPLFRCKLYRVGGQKYICSLVMHHLISDGWSVRLIESVLRQVVSGKNVDWEKVSGSYIEYAKDINRFVQTETYNKRLNYWESYLRDLSDLRFHSQSQGAFDESEGDTCTYHVPLELSGKISVFCQSHSCTPFLLYSSVYLMALSRIFKQCDFVVGFPYLGREQSKYKQVVGYFVHTLLLRYKKEYDTMAFEHYLKDLHACLMLAEENAVAFDKLAKIMRENSQEMVSALHSMFTFDEKILSYHYWKQEKVAFDLVLTVLSEEGASVSCRVEYKRSCFSLDEIGRFISCYFSLLDAVVSRPDKLLSSYSLASLDYVQSVVNSNILSASALVDLHSFEERFAVIAHKYAQHTAIICNEERITYQELDRLSEEIARSIKSAGIAPYSSIAVCMPASVNCMAVILGILKAGCCYVPIDVDFPKSRYDFILRDASCRMLFNEENFPVGSVLSTEIVSGHTKELQGCAYIIYTSGTTGLPKGVPISRLSLVRLLETERERLNLSADSHVLLFASLSFDASVFELFPAFYVGATLVIASPDERKDPELLFDLLRRHCVTSATIPPAILPLLPHKPLPDLDTIILGGESTALSALEYWRKNHTVINAYGPTENTVATTMCVVDESFEPNDIGLPLPGVSCYVLDEQGNILPPDMPGELYIGGIQLTDGYLNRPELNDEKFIENPYVTSEEEVLGINVRLYKSGDLVKRHANGHLIFIGRVDNQVKLHGYRIELGDIETKIMEFGAGIKNVAVLLYGTEKDKRLVAYLQTRLENGFPLDELKKFLYDALPQYMVPSAFVILKDFPYTTNQKIDRKRLPAPVFYEKERNVEMPFTETEQRLAQLWKSLLPTAVIGREDTFISLGGESMGIIQLSFLIEKEFGFKVKVSDIYAHKTLKELARFIEEYEVGRQSEVISSDEGKHLFHTQIPLPPAQFSLWLECMRSKEVKDSYNVPCVFDLPADVEPSVYEEAFNRLVSLQDGFRIFFSMNDGGKPCLQVLPYKTFAIPVEEISTGELQDRLNQDLAFSFDLSCGPLFRCKLYRVDKGNYVFSLVMHHLITDGWSVQLIHKILTQVAFRKDVDWNQFAGSYMEYALDVDSLVNSDVYGNRLDYWTGYLQNVSDLKFQGVSRMSDSAEGACCRVQLPIGLSEAVVAFCREHACSPFLFYCSVYMMLLARFFRQTGFTVGIPYWGREQERYNQVIGYFIHTLPMLYKESYDCDGFMDYLNDLQECLVKGEENAVSLIQLTEAVRSLQGKTDFQLVKTMFVFEEKTSFDDFFSRKHAPLSLALTILSDTDNHVWCQVEYRTAEFNQEFVGRLVSAYQALIGGVLQNPNRELRSYSLASALYCQSVITANSLCGQFGKEPLPFLNRFSLIARTYPQQTAVVCEGKSMTYQELDEQSDWVARRIRLAGIPVHSSIAVCMHSSIECVVAILGILKAGCCYVPIDTELPAERKEFILKDAACRFLFDEQYFPCGKVLEDISSVDVTEALQDCAYVIYTSGTTGQPKGVPVKQMALAHLLEVESSRLGLSAESRVLLFSNISFDASVLQLFPALSVGATLFVATSQERKDPRLIADLMESQRITWAAFPPAFLALLPHRRFPALATLVVGGESAAMDVVEYWREGRVLINAYGPTENTVDTTLCLVDGAFESNDIGLLLPGVSGYVLDECLNIVPEGMVGELYIGGLRLTSGYLNRSELNQEKFIENPYVTPEDKAEGINTRLYKSGDLVRRRSDGHLIFMGRTDSQVKLRGFRVELAEIESLLQQCVGVRHALVEVRKKDKQEELVAFVQFDKQASSDVLGLQAVLRDKLPAYMIPSKWAIVDEFPLTMNGKIDRRRLPEPDVVVKRALVGADTETEKTLLAMVEGIIGTGSIGVETDLLDEAGMTSMQVMEFVGKVITETDLRITVSSVYKSRTIRKLLCDTEGRPYFWFDGFDERKPVLVFITGFPAVSPFYDALLRFFARDYSVFVFDSYYDFFVGKDAVSLDVLLHSYEEVLTEVLGDKPVAMLTGYCTGAELAIAFAAYMRKKHPEKALYPILNMEGVYRRQEADEIPETITEEPLRGRIRITNELYKGFPLLEYTGPIVHVMAGKASKMIYWEKGEETDELILEQMRQALEANHKDWQRHYPNAPYYELDCNHWTFFEEKNLRALREIIRKHWNI